MGVGKGAYQQVVVPELLRISFPLQVLSDGRVSTFAEHAHRAGVEARDIEQHTPHPGVEDAFSLAKHAAQASSGPLEHAGVARDAERHIGLDHFYGPLVQLEETKEVRVRRGVEDDLRDKGSQVVRAMARTGRGRDSISGHGTLTNPLISKE